MSISKVVIFTAVASTLAFAKIDFVNFGDICETKATQSCKNNTIEIKAVQYLLKKRLNSDITVNGKIDDVTKKSIISLQLKEGIPANGYIGKKTKDVLNKLLYGYKLHDTKVAKNGNVVTDKSVKKVAEKKVEKVNIAKKIDTKKEPKQVVVKKVSNDKKVAINVKAEKKRVAKKSFSSYREFIDSVNLKKSYAVYKDSKLLNKANGKNTLLKVDVKKQRVKLVVNGKVALDAPCTTGAKRKFEPNTKTYRDKHTPTGTFRIMEKIALKRSTIFGDIYKHGRVIYHGDRRKYRGSWKGVKYVGHPLKNWMRLTSSGIGLHASKYVKRYAGSNGCIRLQPKVASTIFRKIKPGTKVKVYN